MSQSIEQVNEAETLLNPKKSKSRAMIYRSDIDGLRAIAVLSVLFFHLGLPFVPGGYVGVDIFFVISGFLITRIIHKEALAGTFSLLDFYERRARRILPALITVVLASIIAAHFLLAPFEYDDFGLSAMATLLFASNFHFKDAINYFAPAVEFHPLLHTWSLAVEEQFYLLFPLLLVAALSIGRLVSGLFVLLVLSFVASVLAISYGFISQEAAFYMLPLRAWELLIGSILALDMIAAPKNRLVREGLALLGAVLIAIAVLVFTSKTPFPGLTALLPCLGAALIIFAGEGGRSLISRFLSLKPLVFVGLISYSLYLWHWPILAFLRYMRNDVSLDNVDLVGAFALSILLATASWWLVEKPFRNRQWLSQKQIFTLSGSTMGFLALIGLFIHLSEGIPERISPELRIIAAGANDTEPNRRSCAKRRTIESLCRLGPVDAPADVLLWGDSHAGAMMSAIETAAKAHGHAIRLATAAGCVPFTNMRFARLDGKRKKDEIACERLKKDIINWLEGGDHQIKTVVLSARWAMASTGKMPVGEPGPDIVLARPGRPLPTKAQAEKIAPALFAKGLEETLSRLKSAGLKVILIGSVPEISWSVPRTLVATTWRGKKPPAAPTSVQVAQRHAIADRIMKRLAEKYAGKFISLRPLLCASDCLTVLDGHPLYVDDDHLSAYGAREVVGPYLVPFFKDMIKP